GIELKPTGERPITSINIDIVFAVYWPPHAPAPGHATASSSARSASEIFPAAAAPMASYTSPTATCRPRQVPGMIEPPYSKTAGRSTRIIAIADAGTVVSPADRHTDPSH